LKKILILFAHPAFHKSIVNRSLIKNISQFDNITFNDLYEIYPDYDIDVEYEQKLLLDHDIIIFQFPFYWYSTPAILREWQDLVLTHGWAYGSKGHALAGKIFFCTLTTGGSKNSYQKDGYNRFTIDQLLTPLEQTANLCKMVYLKPFVIYNALNLTEEIMSNFESEYKKLLFGLQQ